MKNVANDKHKQKSAKKRDHAKTQAIGEEEYETDDFQDTALTIEDKLDSVMLKKIWMKAEELFKKKYKKDDWILFKRILEECSYRQISEQLGIKEATARKRVERIRQRFGKLLQQVLRRDLKIDLDEIDYSAFKAAFDSHSP